MEELQQNSVSVSANWHKGSLLSVRMHPKKGTLAATMNLAVNYKDSTSTT